MSHTTCFKVKTSSPGAHISSLTECFENVCRLNHPFNNTLVVHLPYLHHYSDATEEISSATAASDPESGWPWKARSTTTTTGEALLRRFRKEISKLDRRGGNPSLLNGTGGRGKMGGLFSVSPTSARYHGVRYHCLCLSEPFSHNYYDRFLPPSPLIQGGSPLRV